MKAWIFFVLFILIFKPLILANTPIIKCDLSNSKYTGQLSLDAVGQGLLKFKPKRSSKKKSPSSSQTTTSCRLIVYNIRDVSRGVVPRMTVVFLRELCQPVSEDFYSKIFTDRIVLDIDLSNRDKPSAKVRWLKEYHPENCDIKNIRLSDLQLNAKKFQQGKWPLQTQGY